MATPTPPTVPYWQFALGNTGAVVTGLDELAQALKILLLTPLGSCPLRPDFGCDISANLDAPGPQAVAATIKEISRAVATWEPRITLKSIQTQESTAEGRATLLIKWLPTSAIGSSADSSTQTTEVSA